MTDEPTETTIVDAFEELRREASFTRAAVEGLTAARDRIPDYTPTLSRILEHLDEALLVLDRIEEAPALRLSPEALATEIVKAGLTARSADAQLVHQACDALSRSTGAMDGMIKRGQAADRQLTQKLWHAVGGLVGGILIWSILPGAIARSLPASWHVPLWMAERTLGRANSR